MTEGHDDQPSQGLGNVLGKVKWFNNAKGYGFILPDAGGDDLFAHYSSIMMDGYKTLKAGQAVSFDVVEGPKGLHAVNIREADAQDDEDAAIGVSVELDMQDADPSPSPSSHGATGT